MKDYTLVRIDYMFSMPNEDYLEMRRKLSASVAHEDELLWTAWPADVPHQVAGGMYLFESKQAAIQFANGPVVSQLQRTPGIHGVQVKVSDISQAPNLLKFSPHAQAAVR